MSEPRSPHAVGGIRGEIARVINSTDSQGRIVGNAKWGSYCFYDFDGEPIYVGQTKEQLRTRIRRHLTNQRTDAVAMNVLDPFEVCWIEMWPLWEYEGVGARDSEFAAASQHLNALEYTVYEHVLKQSPIGAVLNEKDMQVFETVLLPESLRGCVIPESMFAERKHSDVRIARRAQTIAALAKVISEREVSSGLRRTLVTQARRLERLASNRYEVLNHGADADLVLKEFTDAGREDGD